MKTFRVSGRVMVSTCLLAAAVYWNEARADWDPGDPAKWVQLPDLQPTGLDVLDTAPKILADDFLCTFTGPITDIHIWGSWLNNQVGVITNLHVSFHSDVPAGGEPFNSHPGTQLWSTNFALGQYTQRLYANANEQFYNPNTGTIIGSDTQVYQYNMFIDPAQAFTQQVNNIYWLDVTAYTTNGLFGWKTSLQHFNDDAVWSDLPNPLLNELRYPAGHPLQGQSIDLAFALTTIPEPSVILLVALGSVGLWVLKRRR